jgi:enterochelin esterase-like enzyme
MLVCLMAAVVPWAGVSRVQAGSVQGHLEKHTIVSKIFDDSRTIYVWLPTSYAASDDKAFPLLLALQGENLFDGAVAAGGDEWAVDELLSRSPGGIPEFVVVGVVSAANAVRE